MATLLIPDSDWKPSGSVGPTVEVTIPEGLSAGQVLDAYAEFYPTHGRRFLYLARVPDNGEEPETFAETTLFDHERVAKDGTYFIGTTGPKSGYRLPAFETVLKQSVGLE